MAIGAGVGVPLGIIALAACAWAFYERKRANLMAHNNEEANMRIHEMAASGPYSSLKSAIPVELDSNRLRTPELMDRE